MRKIIDRFFSSPIKPFLFLAALGFLLYAQALFFDFTYLDDNTLILNNQTFLSNFSHIGEAFQTDVFRSTSHSVSYYRPILTLFFMVVNHINGASSFFYHLAAIILHILAAILVFIFLKKLKYEKALAFFCALIFLVHPVLTQAVAWVPGLNDSLLTVFVLTSFIYFIDFLEEKRVAFFWLSLIFFTLGIFTKETGLFALPVFVFFTWFVKKDWKIFWREKKIGASWVTVFILWFSLRHYALRGNVSLDLKSAFRSVFENSPAVVQYLGKIFFPFNLSVLPIIRDTAFIWGILAVILLSILFFITKRKRWNFLSFGIFWFFLFLAPSFIRPNPTLAADFIEHRVYLPLIGLIIILLELRPLKKWRVEKRIFLIPSLAIIVLFIFLTIRHSRVFHDRLSFWKNAVDHSSDYPLARRNLGAMYYLEGNIDAAEKEFKAALELNPEEAMAHSNLGLIYAQKEKLSEAEKEYKKEIEINPYYDNAYYNLGLLYYKENKSEDARKNWKTAIGINPGHIGALRALAGLAYAEERYKDAAAYAVAIRNTGAPLPDNLAKLLDPLTFIQLENKDLSR